MLTSALLAIYAFVSVRRSSAAALPPWPDSASVYPDWSLVAVLSRDGSPRCPTSPWAVFCHCGHEHLSFDAFFDFAVYANMSYEVSVGLAPFGWLVHSRNDSAIPMALGVGVLRARSVLRFPLPDLSFFYTCLDVLSATASSLFFSCAFLCTFLVI